MPLLPSVLLLLFMNLQNNLPITLITHTMSLPNRKYFLAKRKIMGPIEFTGFIMFPHHVPGLIEE